MSRTVRITVGAVVAGTLAFVALVAGVMAAAPGPGGFLTGLDEWGPDAVDTTATAEVLDVDDEGDWPTVDVRWTTPDGEVVVTYVDWEWSDDLPVVGDRVDVVYDASDPELAFAADDPWVADVVAGPAGAEDAVEPTDAEADGAGATAGVAGWVALGALLALLVTVAVTVVAAVRAPRPSTTPWDHPGAVAAFPPSYAPAAAEPYPHPGPGPWPPAGTHVPQGPPPRTWPGNGPHPEPGAAPAGQPPAGPPVPGAWSSP
ncbi:hypothetical protein [Jannaschia sp. R86511]|uniref:hypothetical protein n=1 Tax=Jannaschia sp. R86511 TaxID=3093853 RepID=UPI0036D41D5F